MPRHLPPEPSAAETRRIQLGGRDIPYRLTVSMRARRVRLVIRPVTGLEVVVPRGTSATHAERVLREKARWVVATLERVALAVPATAPPLAEGQTLPFLGRALALRLRAGAPAWGYHVALRGESLTVITGTGDAADQETLRAALELWYRRQARAVFTERVARANAAFGFSYGRISIKDQKSRWGSCSRLGNLNFNWRLLLAPPEVLDYVVVHELAHLREGNHGPRFWTLVAGGCPDYRRYRLWLRQHGQELRF